MSRRTAQTIKVEIEEPDFAPYQESFIYSRKRFTITQAGTKTGKTFSHSFWLFACAHAADQAMATQLNPYLRPAEPYDEYTWAAPTVKQTKIGFKEMKKRVIQTPGYHIINSSGDMSISTPLDTVVRFITTKDSDNIYGPENKAAVYDEFTRGTLESWVALRSTLTFTNGPCKLIGNFKGNANWGNQLGLKADLPGSEYEQHRVTAYDAVRAGILTQKEIDQARQDMPLFLFKALYLAEGEIDQARLVDDEAIKDLRHNPVPEGGRKHITADIAGHGSDRFIIAVWEGMRLIDLMVMDECDSKKAMEAIQAMADKHSVSRSKIAYDADGIGWGMSGWFDGAYAFHNGASPIKVKMDKQDYKNLKSQCYFMLAKVINDGDMVIACDVDKYWTDIMEELEVIKNRAYGTDGKLEVLRKEEIREIIGRSPDFTDILMMRMVFELTQKFQAQF